MQTFFLTVGQNNFGNKIPFLIIFQCRNTVRWEKARMYLLDLLCSGNKGSGSSDTCITVSGTGWQEVDGLAAITTSLFWLCALAYLAFTTFCILFLSSDIDRGVRLVGSHYCRRHKPRSALTQIGPQTLAAHNISSEPFYFRSKIPSQYGPPSQKGGIKSALYIM